MAGYALKVGFRDRLQITVASGAGGTIAHRTAATASEQHCRSQKKKRLSTKIQFSPPPQPADATTENRLIVSTTLNHNGQLAKLPWKRPATVTLPARTEPSFEEVL